jgi:arsenate reductase (thioredoxin)
MPERVYNVLFLSRRNSARSIMAEAVLNREGRGRFKAFSAGVESTPALDPHAVEVMQLAGLPVSDVGPKHYREFAKAGAADLDFVFTLSDTAAGEPLPEWPGLPVTAHWSSPDPTKAEGAEWEIKQAYGRALTELERRIRIFANLPFASLDRISLKSHLDEIGQSRPNS